MSGKSQRKTSRSKRRMGRQGASPVAAERQAVGQTAKPVSRTSVSAPAASASTRAATMTASRYPYLGAELRRITILAGTVLAILVILALLFG
jgi:hypothetical protein